MKLYFILFLTFVISLFSLISCSILESNSDHANVVGEWEWVKSTGGFAGHIVTPDSAGYSEQQLRFWKDDKFSFFQADTLVASGQYALFQKSGDFMIKYNSVNGPHLPNQWIEFNQQDTLILRDRCTDCYTSVYTRIN